MHLWKKERKKSSLFFSGNDIKCDFLIWYHDIDQNYLGAGLPGNSYTPEGRFLYGRKLLNKFTCISKIVL